MRGISKIHGATNQEAPSKPRPRIKLRVTRLLSVAKDKIRRYTVDAFRNAKDIMLTNKRISNLETKLKKAIEDPRESKIDYALEAFRKSEADHTKSINKKLFFLIFLWLLDKLVILAFFSMFKS